MSFFSKNTLPNAPNSSSGIKFDRNEFAGSLGDIGTDLPLLTGIILASGLEPVNVLVVFGLAQIASGLIYRMPMPIQPLKAMAALVIAQGCSASVIAGAGIAIGTIMIVLTLTGMLERMVKVVPTAVVRGIQFGLGIKLALIALHKYLPSAGMPGYVLATIGGVLAFVLLGSRRYPSGLFLIPLGVVWAAFFTLDFSSAPTWLGVDAPSPVIPTWDAIVTGTLVLALPQLPLSISNSVISTHKLAGDLYPEKAVTVKKIGVTYSLANLIAPLFGGFPVCHGSGGLVGHHTFGGRSGGSVIIYGCGYILFGTFLSNGFGTLVHAFPLPILGVILLFESLALMAFIKDVAADEKKLTVALLVAVISAGLPGGFLIGTILGTIIMYSPAKLTFRKSRNKEQLVGDENIALNQCGDLP